MSPSFDSVNLIDAFDLFILNSLFLFIPSINSVSLFTRSFILFTYVFSYEYENLECDNGQEVLEITGIWAHNYRPALYRDYVVLTAENHVLPWSS
jgi:hypothetical protein